MSEQRLDIRRLISLTRRHRWIAAVFALAGCLVAAGYLVARPPLYSANSLVLIPGSTQSSSTSGQQATTANDVTTDEQIATSAAVLATVSKRDPHLSIGVLRSRVTASSNATNVVQITARGSSAEQAQHTANWVAAALVKYVTGSASSSNSALVTGLEAEAQQLSKQLAATNSQVLATLNRINKEGASSPSGQQDSSLLTTLSNNQSQTTLQLDNVNSQLSQAKVQETSSNDGTEVLQYASTATPPSYLRAALIIVLGGVLGLLLGMLVIALRFQRDARLVNRDDFAEALGVPVLLSLPSVQAKSSRDWRELFESFQPHATDQWNTRRLLRQIGVSEHGRIDILFLEKDDAGATVGPHLAVLAASQGYTSCFSITGKFQAIPQLRMAIEQLASRGGIARTNLSVRPSPSESETNDLTVAAGAISPRDPELSDFGTTLLLAVSPGSATADDLANVAIAAADAGNPLTGIVVVSPDAADRTTGLNVTPVAAAGALGRQRTPSAIQSSK